MQDSRKTAKHMPARKILKSILDSMCNLKSILDSMCDSMCNLKSILDSGWKVGVGDTHLP